MAETECPVCKGEGETLRAMSGETLGAAGDARRRRRLRGMGKVSCAFCGGSGKRAASDMLPAIEAPREGNK
jgi:hypothetical protein